MDYGRPALAERLAAEYVLGTLRGRARQRFETLMGAHPALRQAVLAWYERLMPLTALVKPVQPVPATWQRVQQRLFSGPRAQATPKPAPQRVPSWRRWLGQVAVWQGVAAFATVVAVSLTVLQLLPGPAPVVIVLSAPAGSTEASAALPTSFVASVSGDGRSLVLKPLRVGPLETGRALQLWAVPGRGAPRSLGLVSDRAVTRVQQAQLLIDTAAFAVSLEPKGGSPTGAPTGPIVSVGKLEL